MPVASLYKCSVASFECFISSCANPITATPLSEWKQGLSCTTTWLDYVIANLQSYIMTLWLLLCKQILDLDLLIYSEFIDVKFYRLWIIKLQQIRS